MEDFIEDPPEIPFEELSSASRYLELYMYGWVYVSRYESDTKGLFLNNLSQTQSALKAVVKLKLTLVYEGHSRSLHSFASQRESFHSPVRKTK